MNSLTPTEELVSRAFQLAYFIHSDKAVALRIATEAMLKLESASAAQDKRLYYNPTGRTASDESKLSKYRTKVLMSELHLLERLVYVESEPHEKREEQPNGGFLLDEEDMIIRFIKHLVRITLKRNSFYVTLGLSRFLHNYSTAETMDAYNLVVQDPERVKDDYYYRSRKKHLMQEIQERFGNLLKVVRGQRGEERFETHDDPRSQAGLVKESLSLFTPWKTACVLPARFNPLTDTVRDLAFEGGNPDEEHPVEVNRIHSVLHPDCFSRLIKALGFDSSDERVAVPKFFLSKSDSGKRPRGDRRRPPKLGEEEFATIRNALAEQAARRKASYAGLLLIVVDGTERARLDLNQTSRVQFEVEEGAELVEVRAREETGDLLLAAHLLTYDETQTEPKRTSIVLEAGQKVSFAVSLTNDSAGDITGATVDVSYKETNPVRAASLFWRQTKHQVSQLAHFENWRLAPVMKPVLVVVFVVVCAVGVMLYVQSRKQAQSSQPIVAEQMPPATNQQPSPPPVQEVPKSSSPTGEQKKLSQRSTELRQPTDVARQRETAPPEITAEDVEATRALQSEAVRVQLLSAKRIYVDPLGSDDPSQQVREQLIRALQSSNRFTVIESRDSADAVLKGSVRREKTGGQISLRLVNAAGEVLWATAEKSTLERESDFAADLGKQVVTRLLDVIRRIKV
jgi:hypothetical protein